MLITKCTHSMNKLIISRHLILFTFHAGCPIKVRTDAGTENYTLAQIHSYFRQGEDFFLIGKSTGNQVYGVLARLVIKRMIML